MKFIASLIGAAALATLSLSVHAQAAKPDLKKGAELFGQVCVACHAADGNSTVAANPKLAQQHPEYLVKQLQEFKSGKRANAVMAGFAAAMSEADMRNVSYWLASQPAKTGFSRDKDLVTLGERIYRGGIADRKVAACAGCHAPNGVGIPAQYPRLAGQHADYTSTQMKAFRAGERKNSTQMAQISAYMTDKEIAAVADYIAGLR
ncbi:c-type cytochrome [Macromonas nakdongensis]|uniref:c-type cytochrome n=1 Tax=Macromonas nakdongensis TaxID=1843082 RepID=UPI000C33CBBA|nr:c-type cytochrome [Macromonas nakdongensis]